MPPGAASITGREPLWEAINALLAEEFILRENPRVKTALVMGRLYTIKMLAGLPI